MMFRAVALPMAAVLLLGAAPPKRADVAQCERVASRAACDPVTGYIAGPGGPCRPSDLRCIENVWVDTGRIIYFPSLGLCGRNHEDGGTIEICPPGVGPARPRQPRTGGSGSGTGGNALPPPASSRRRPPPPPPPAPPTLDEALATCPGLPAPRLHRNPDHEGVTGMETWMWADAHAPVRSTGNVRGYPVTCTATAEQWTFYSGDGATYSRGTPGTQPPQHAATHIYQRKGQYTQRLAVRWRLETNQGRSSTTQETSRAYRVVEIRAALVE